jgi:hypothetical protein
VGVSTIYTPAVSQSVSSIQRNEDGSFKDDDLANILQNAWVSPYYATNVELNEI